ncbi:MAG: hypothetical protein BWY92_01774 [Firmicutes bacterium ADurb.BinA052]|nr:MAG: hypothetical protein BWY92_01774 [Firmicutes bacterium ADurb.BinA052]
MFGYSLSLVNGLRLGLRHYLRIGSQRSLFPSDLKQFLKVGKLAANGDTLADLLNDLGIIGDCRFGTEQCGKRVILAKGVG